MKLSSKIIISLSLLIAPFVVLAAPGIPHQFYGNVTYTNGTPISSGNVIVKIGATQVASVPISNGKYGYNPDLLLVTDQDDNRPGSILKFFIDSVDTGKTAVFVKGGYTNLNLDALVAPTSTPTPTPTTGGGGGGSLATPTPSPSPNASPTATPLSTEAKKADTNNDAKIDVLDFNGLMVNWGSSGGVADFTGDGQVDVFDFNYLMIYWTT